MFYQAVSVKLRNFPLESALDVLSKSCREASRIGMRVVSEGPVRITKATIDAAWRRRSSDIRLVVRDKDCRGLALIVNATSMAWSYAYRPRGTNPRTGGRWPNRTVALGNPATHSPDDARAATNRIKGQVLSGGDPAADRKAQAEAERWRQGITLGRLATDYARAFARRPKVHGYGSPSPKYVASELAQLRLALEAMNAAELPAPSLTEAMLRQLLNTPTGQGSIAGKRFGAMSRFMDWCQEAGYVPTNPCSMVPRTRRPRRPQPRSHYLSLDELARLWCAADGLRQAVSRDLARFLIAVPCRRAEGSNLEWEHLDLNIREWRQPAHLTKNRDPHRLHMHSLAFSILDERHKAAGCPTTGLVFPAPRSRGAVTSFNEMKRGLSEKAGVSGWAWHDLRRSFATALGEAGISEAVADAVLNHRQSATRGGVLGVYQRATRWPEQVKVMEHWGQLLAAAIDRSDYPLNSATSAAGNDQTSWTASTS
jgi:integrase